MHFGIVCVSSPSHVMCAGAIGREIQKRGHRITLFAPLHAKPWVDAEGLSTQFLSYCPELLTHLDTFRENQGKMSWSQIIEGLIRDAAYVQRELPPAIENTRVECLVIDGSLPGAGSTADALGLPFVNFFCGLPPHEEPAVPPIFLPWLYAGGVWYRARNRGVFGIRDYLVRPLLREMNRFRRDHGLKPYRSVRDTFSSLAQVTQLLRQFDFPRTQLPACFHYVGPYIRQEKQSVLPFELRSDRPLVYAAMGTILGADSDLWPSIAEACSQLDVQLVIALGTKNMARTYANLPGDNIVLPYAPQETLLAKAAVFITHAGLNSVLQALAQGVPMLAIPGDGDMQGVAARIAFHGVGKLMGGERRSPEALRQALTELLTDGRFRDRCGAMSGVFQTACGAETAACIFERVKFERQPVLLA